MSNPTAQDNMGDDEPDQQHVDLIENLRVVGGKNPENECTCGSERCRTMILSQEMDRMLSPVLTYHSAQFEHIWPLMAGSTEVSSYLALLSEYQAERHCGTAWLQDFVAYRCRTCSDSPNMAICAECFKNGNHQGHDYNMFKSGSGGACDCGFEIVKDSGHCSRHGQNATAKRANEPVPDNLICIPRRMMPRLVHRLAIQLRKSLSHLDAYLDCLMQIVNSTAVLRSLMIDALISEEVYSSQINVLNNQLVGNEHTNKIFKLGMRNLEFERKCLKPFKIPDEWKPPTKDIKAFCDNVPITCFIDELVFWMIVYELPEKLVCFLLGLLMDERYRQIFARSFVRNYPRILQTLIGARSEPSRHLTRESYDKLSRRILHVSVQLYCHPDLTRQLCDEEYCLHTIIYCLRAAIEGTSPDSSVLEPNLLRPPTNQMQMVVSTESPLIRDRHLRSFTGDLYNILACENEVFRLLNDVDLINTWLEMLSNFQTMNPYKRELNEHTLYDNGPHMSVFAVEADFCDSPLWSILSCLKDGSTIKSSQALLSALHTNLARWFYGMGFGPNSLLDPYHMSFHIPIHRMFAATLRHMMFTQKMSEHDLHKFISSNQTALGTQCSYRSASGVKTPINFTGFIKMLLLHPLQALTLYNEIRSTMWTRNGISIINQAITYVHCACSFSTVDLDMFLLKYSASKLNPNYFIKTLMSRFHAWKWFSFKSNILMMMEEVRQLYHFNILPEQVILMVESSLVTLIQLLTLSIYCNVSEREQTRQEMVALISVIDRSYSYLLNMLPDRGVTNFGSANQDFVSLLDELTSYKPAQHGTSGNLQQGSYTLKPVIWDREYDPIQVLYRFYQKRDYQMSLERFFQHAKLTGKLDRRYHPSSLWPPLKIPRNLSDAPDHLNLVPLFECQTLIGLVFTIIHKNLYYVDVPDSIMAYTIHLLELSLRTCLQRKKSDQQQQQPQTSSQSDKRSRSNVSGEGKPLPPTIDPSFVGHYRMKELQSCPAYIGPRDESNIKGNTIFSVPDAGNGEDTSGGDCGDSDDRLFPVVKNALDLGFDSTWFPFVSVIENCLVHVENVHLIPWREFETLLESQQDPPDQESGDRADLKAGTSKTTDSSCLSASMASTPAPATTTAAAHNSDAEMFWSEHEYDETGIEEMIDDIDPDEDVDDDDDDDDGEEDDDDYDDDEDDGNGDDDDNNEVDDAGQVMGTSSYVWRSRQDSSSQADREEAEGRAPHVAENLIMLNVHAGESTTEHARRQQTAPPSNYQQHQQGSATGEQQTSSDGVSQLRQGDLYRLIPVIRARRRTSGTSASADWAVATATTTDEPANSQMTATTTATVDNSTSVVEDNNNVPDRSIQMYPENLVTQRRAALEAPEAVPMIEDAPQPLALEAGPSHLSAESSRRRSDAPSRVAPQVGGVDSNRGGEDRSLSEMDIHARFVGFFQPRQTDSHRSHLRGFRHRQVARRGAGYRSTGQLVTPLVVHNPNQNETPPPAYHHHRQGDAVTGATAWLAHPIEQAHNNNNNSTNNNNNNNNNNINAANENETSSRGEQHSRDAMEGTTSTVQLPAVATTITPSTMMIMTTTPAAEAATVAAATPTTTTTAPTAANASTTTTTSYSAASRDPRITRRPSQCSCTLLSRALSSRLQQDLRSSQRRLRGRDRMHHGESLLSLLLRLHAKYSHRANSYEYNESRARANLSPDRTRIGDGVHFVTIVLDLICQSDQGRMLAKVSQLQRLIWAAAWTTSTGERSGFRATDGSTASSVTTKMQVDGDEDEPMPGTTANIRVDGNNDGGGDDDEVQQLDFSSRGPVKLEDRGSGNQSKGTTSNAAAGANQGPESGSTFAATTTTAAATPASSGGGGSAIPSASLDPQERRRRAKEFQSRLMADFANKQRAFIEKYESTQQQKQTSPGSGGGKSSDKIELGPPDEEPINLSSKMSSAGASSSGHQKEEARPQMSASDKQPPQSPLASGRGSGDKPPTTPGRIQELTSTADNSGGGSGNSDRLTSDERPRPSTSSAGGSNQSKGADHEPEEEEDTYECCICGGGPNTSATTRSADDNNLDDDDDDASRDDLTNPLGQVVLLQATSVYGHAHLRPREERRLPCDDVEQLQLQEETYAKYLSRRIDLMCEHFCESSRLDTINIGAEGGVHVQSCGHYLHIECHQSYIKSLDQEDRPHARNQDTDGFLCPVCRQLANSVLPILASSSSSSSTSSAPRPSASPLSQPTQSASDYGSGSGGGELALRLEQQIKLIGSLLEHRLAPNQRELQSSASFCQHLTKATGSEYRRIRSEPNMHSLFLFLTSIARTNLETEVIMRANTRSSSASPSSPTTSTTTAAGNITSSCNTTTTERAIASTSADASGKTTRTTTGTTTEAAPRQHVGGGGGHGRRQRSCFLLLLQVLALNSRTLIEDHWFTYDQLWAHLTQQADEKNRLSVKPMKRSEVPLLLRDPVAMLLQFLFAITNPKHLSYQATNFTCLVQMLLNLTVIQSIALVLSYIAPQDKAKLLPPSSKSSASSSSLSAFFVGGGGGGSGGGDHSKVSRHGDQTTANLNAAAADDDNRYHRTAPSANESSRLPNVRPSYDKPIHCLAPATAATTKRTASREAAETEATNQFSSLLGLVLQELSPLLLPTNEEPLLDQRVRSRWSAELNMTGLDREKALSLAQNRTKLACLPFLRSAALIRHHLYGQPMPDLESLAADQDELLCDRPTIEADFSKLIGYLQLDHSTSSQLKYKPSVTTSSNYQSLVDALNWPPGARESLVSSWAAELLRFGSEFSIAARSLLVCRPLAWHRPSLMKLPDSFDDIFLFYYRKECSLCHQIPKDVAICLVCGAPVCFRNGCCKARSGSRQLHSHHCGAGTAIFLAIQTSSIVVIRGNRACVWGSVYLDAHDEEDSGLQRGKPLHLVQARYRLLEDQWLMHTFDHTCGKRWIYLQEQ